MKKKIIGAICIFMILGIVALLLARYQEVEAERVKQAERAEQERIAMLYFRVNSPFFLRTNQNPPPMNENRRYREFPVERGIHKNAFGIDTVAYNLLLFYWRETGRELSFEMVLDYFSQEYEKDGTLRFYNNGNHPEMQGLIEWMWEGEGNRRWREFEIYRGDIFATLLQYARAHEEGFEQPKNYELSPQMLRALERATRDPEYVLDLTSLQQAGY